VREGLLDEIVIHLAPVLLGDGTRLFTAPGGKLSPSGARRWPRLGRSPTCGSAS
jgi:riboflavin biosynthesis pyrimidine reductase